MSEDWDTRRKFKPGDRAVSKLGRNLHGTVLRVRKGRNGWIAAWKTDTAKTPIYIHQFYLEKEPNP